MKKNGILNPQLNRVISEMGHRDMLIIADEKNRGQRFSVPVCP